jgi:PAT family beta-lactamase induction signal transducer AmpG
MKRWLEALSVYRDPRVVSIVLLGFSSGLPLALTFSTLSVWLEEAGVSKSTIGLFALVGMPYTFKFLWAPVVDQVRVPLLGAWLGRRRGWAVTSQLALMLAVVGLGAADPARNAGLTSILAFLVALCSATQDIVIDAYRVEILQERQYGAGAAAIVFGYRLGMLTSGAGALYLASQMGWFQVYVVMAGLVMVGILTIALSPEPRASLNGGPDRGRQTVPEDSSAAPDRSSWRWKGVVWLRAAVISPMEDFVGRRGWLLILLFIMLYKLGDALAGVMANPFYLETGFTKTEIAQISKLFGMAATIAGGFLGGVMVGRLGIPRSLLVCGVLQMLSNLTFAVQALVGRDLTLLAVAIGTENLTGGMGTAAFVAYLSSLCNFAYTATQYALLSSFMSFARTLLASSGGWLADQLTWVSFFLVSTVAALPGLILLLWMLGRLRPEPAPGR